MNGNIARRSCFGLEKGILPRTLVAACLMTLASASALAAEWPQFRGPNRDGKSAETGLLQSWPKDGPAKLWTLNEAGAGYSSVAVVGDRLFTMGMDDNEEFVACFSAKDGKKLWRTKNGAPYRNGMGDGPRGTPTVDGDLVYALGANGDLCCLKAQSGAEVWRLNILKEFQGQNIGWGISESPLVEGNLVIVTPGGTKATLAALDKRTGKTVWTSKDPANTGAEPAGYASCITFDVGGQRQIATFTSKGAIGVAAQDGKFLWRHDKAANGTANCATPLFAKNQLFCSSNYGTGCALVQLKPGGPASEVYFNKNMQNHHGGMVLHEGHVYGFSDSVLACLEWETGSQKWRDRSVGKGAVTFVDGLLYLLSEDGVMGLARPSPSGYQEISRFKLPDRSDRPSWAYPVVANGRLYIRDQGRVHCYDVRGR